MIWDEKSLHGCNYLSVPQTDTGGLVEDTEAFERIPVKELGKITP